MIFPEARATTPTRSFVSTRGRSLSASPCRWRASSTRIAATIQRTSVARLAATSWGTSSSTVRCSSSTELKCASFRSPSDAGRDRVGAKGAVICEQHAAQNGDRTGQRTSNATNKDYDLALKRFNEARKEETRRRRIKQMGRLSGLRGRRKQRKGAPRVTRRQMTEPCTVRRRCQL